MMRRDRWVALATLVMLQLFVVAAGVHLLASDELVEKKPVPVASPEPPPVPVITAGPVLAAGGNGPLPTKGTLTARLAEALGDPALGDSVGAAVVDAETGTSLFASEAGTGITPASTTKIVTAVAALASLGPDARLSTRVVRGPSPNSIILVGGGDPTLTANRIDPSVYPRPASLATLAMRTAKALKAAGTTRVSVSYDDGLYTGPRTAASWKPGYVPEGSVAPVTALMTDSGKVAPGSRQRVSDPSRSAGAAFISQLKKYGIKVANRTARRTGAAANAEEIARVESAPVYALVERALTLSDNDLSEALARHIALKEGQAASFDGGAAAVRTVLTRLRAADGITVFDGSGLSPKNRITPLALARLVAVASSPANPNLHPAISGMPVAGFTGTLGYRFGKSDSAYGLVRAKTGTLDGVSTLAGVTTTKDGRLVAFAFMADDVPPGWGKAEAALDRLAAAVAG
ncbi:D-alanyl-D-alanine carboxypeptidase [Planobispora rosea]|uniref:D-alanyl-D-alanine carboxypeptidase n=1 Tax=Planobispora rosea TaxID=35762 RepID=A0A8J3W9K8_PLARO|nr:D-alanyl-D-alanine carboxypeptidase/D-alanyl-D-alanine-endopeptidase [Planobispora rosea]GGS75328.1 D-alanyl-D-alanine carboxypeptidase [Planobispora rosea]GIH81844.1 D-alanyl-D-alanine carboxypeptidase [Planobispora rosea]